MRNYAEKKRTMCRSILPATNRKGAREVAASIKRRNRRYARSTLRAWATEYNPYDYEGDANLDTNRSIHGWEDCITGAMWERRDHDKIAPIRRWAKAIAERDLAHLSEEDKRMYFKGILPDNTIGRHALGHLEGAAFERPNPYLYHYVPLTDEERAEAEAWREKNRLRFITKVRDLVIKDHALLNARLPGCPIEGLHAVEEWCRTADRAARNIIEGMTP